MEAVMVKDGSGIENLKTLKVLPGFARWILDSQLEKFSRLMLEFSRLEKIPLLKFFNDYSDDQLIEIGKKSGEELLTFIADNRIDEYLHKSLNEWIENRLQLNLQRASIAAEDISLISLVRRRVFRSLVATYSDNLSHCLEVMEEVDRFTAISDCLSFNAYLSIQQEELKYINEQLEIQKQQLLDAQQLAKMGSFIWDMEGGKSQYTPGVFQIFEMEKTSNLESFLNDVHPEDRERLRDAIDNAINSDGIYECKYRYSRKTPKKIWSRGFVQFRDGKAVQMKGTIMDITEQDLLLEKLRESELLHNQAQALTHIGNWSWHIKSGEIFWSDEMYRIYGLVPQSEKISFERFISLIHPDHREKRMAEIRRSLETKKAEDYILRIVTPEGEEKILKGRGEMILDVQGEPVLLNGTCQDITVEYLLNESVREQEAYLNQLITNAPDAVIVIDENSIIQLWNPKTEEIFGWASKEVIGKSLADILIPERFREAHHQGLKRFISTGKSRILNQNIELNALAKNKKELIISITISHALQKGKNSFIAFLRDVTLDHEIRMELQNKTLLLEEKNLQLELTNQELESFNYAASHDLQEPLRKIQVFSGRVIEEGNLNPVISNYMEKINLASARMQKLIKDLLAFSQTTADSGSESAVALSDLLREAKNLIGYAFEESGALITHGKLPVVQLVSFQFLQVFTNLLSNSVKYRKPGVRPEITIEWKKITADTLKGIPLPKRGEYLHLIYRDNGIGFEPQFASKVFDLFVRLHDKDKYSGTGIGLAICKKIIQRHQGYIAAESDGTQGATFHIYLPASRLLSVQTEDVPA
jgi:PAS domain S-box-containing protein